jgi:hypothetical protein
MIKKTVTYNNFDGDTVSEVLHFHFTKAEIAELEASEKGGMVAWGEQLQESGDIGEILEALKKIIGKSYGEKVDGGRRFTKSKDIVDAFLSSEAYSAFLFQLLGNPGEAGEFFKGLVPKGDADQEGKSPSEIARANSEAKMRGFQKPAEKAFVQEAVPEIVETAPAPDVIPATAPGEETAEQKRQRLLAELAELG